MDKSQNAVSVFNIRAVHYQNKYMNVDLYDESLTVFCKLLNTNASVLELACGPGNITRHILNKRSDLKILGTDLAPNMIDLARNNNPEAKFEIMDCRDLLKLNTKFDALLYGFCFPYLSKEEVLKLIHDSTKVLNPKGLIYISTMEDDYSKSAMQTSPSTGDSIFIHYHQADYICDALEQNGFSIEFIRHQEYSSETKTIDLLIIAKLN